MKHLNTFDSNFPAPLTQATRSAEYPATKGNSTESPSFFLNQNQLLTYKQAAQYLSISAPYLRRLKAQGKIPYVPFGTRSVRFRVQSLNSWVEKREIK